jgi:hypothetical protein
VIVKKVWKIRRLTTIWAPTACYRDSFTKAISTLPVPDMLSCSLYLLKLPLFKLYEAQHPTTNRRLLAIFPSVSIKHAYSVKSQSMLRPTFTYLRPQLPWASLYKHWLFLFRFPDLLLYPENHLLQYGSSLDLLCKKRSCFSN